MKAVCLLTFAVLSGCGGEPTDPVAKQIYQRQHDFKAMGRAIKQIEKQVESAEPDLAKIKEAAAVVDQLAGAIPQWFPAGSGPESGFKTEAKAEIWQQPAVFKQKYDDYRREESQLALSIQSGNPEFIKNQFYNTKVACAGCHKQFRTD